MSKIRKTAIEEIDLLTYTDQAGKATDYSRIFVSDSDAPSPLQVGVFRFDRSDMAMRFEHAFDEGKYVIEGEVTMVDRDTGEVCEAKAGDMIHVKANTSVYWWTRSKAVVFFCGASDAQIEGPVWHGEEPVADIAAISAVSA